MKAEFHAVQEKLALVIRDFPDNDDAVRRLNLALKDAMAIPIELVETDEALIMTMVEQIAPILVRHMMWYAMHGRLN